MSVLLHFVSRMIPVPQTMFGINTGGSFVYGIAGNLNAYILLLILILFS